jgi:LysR family transcriptional regulator for bpeEF and oprC
MPSALGSRWIVPQLGEFISAYPSVSVEIVCTDFVPFSIGDGLDLAVQIGELHDSNLGVRRLACSQYLVCASPHYLAANGTPRDPRDLDRHRCLLYRRPRNGRLWEWRFHVDGSVQRFTPAGVLTINSHEALVSAATAGLGLIQVADHYAHAAIQRGALVEILQDFKTEGHIISVVFPKQQPFPPKVRAFIDFLAHQFERPPWLRAAAPPRRSGRAAAAAQARPRSASRE